MIAIVVAHDLMRRSRLEGIVRAAGLEPRMQHDGTPGVVIVDASDPHDLADLRTYGAPVIVVASHVDRTAIEAAEAAGFTVVTRGAFARNGAQMLRELLS